jgi:DNA repair exonuclease SbcCD ATPase subunit
VTEFPTLAGRTMAGLGQQLREIRERAERAETALAAKDARIAELEVAKYPGCKLLSLGDTCPCKICDLERKLAAREAELAGAIDSYNKTTADANVLERERLAFRRRAEQAEAALAACQAERDAAHRRADALVQGTLDAEATLHRLIADQREKREQAEAALADLELDFTSFQEHHAATEAALAERDAELAELKVDPDACATTGHGDVRCERCHQVWPGRSA